MIDREKVIHALETCTRDDFPCKECGYYIEGKDYDCIDTMMRDALDLLREQDVAIDPCKSCQEWECDGCEYAKGR